MGFLLRFDCEVCLAVHWIDSLLGENAFEVIWRVLEKWWSLAYKLSRNAFLCLLKLINYCASFIPNFRHVLQYEWRVMRLLVENTKRWAVHLGLLFLLGQPDWILYLWSVSFLVLCESVWLARIRLSTCLERVRPTGLFSNCDDLRLILGITYLSLAVHFVVLGPKFEDFSFELLNFWVLDWDVPELAQNLGLFLRDRSLERRRIV